MPLYSPTQGHSSDTEMFGDCLHAACTGLILLTAAPGGQSHALRRVRRRSEAGLQLEVKDRDCPPIVEKEQGEWIYGGCFGFHLKLPANF